MILTHVACISRVDEYVEAVVVELELVLCTVGRGQCRPAFERAVACAAVVTCTSVESVIFAYIGIGKCLVYLCRHAAEGSLQCCDGVATKQVAIDYVRLIIQFQAVYTHLGSLELGVCGRSLRLESIILRL